MQKFITVKIETEVVGEIICNHCGKRIPFAGGVPAEGVLHVEKTWGYSSAKDGETHRFDLCEKCYDELLKGFQIPAEIDGAGE